MGHDNQWVVVERVEKTEEFQTVYNLRIADYHTYFVGAPEWGFSLWAHNTYLKVQPVETKRGIRYVLMAGNRYVTKSGELLKGRGNARKFTSQSDADAFAQQVNDQRAALHKALVGPGKLSERAFGQMFSRHGGLKGKLDFESFYLELVAAPSNGQKGARLGRSSIPWDKAVRLTRGVRQANSWELPDRAKTQEWVKHQQNVTKALKKTAAPGQPVGEQVELHVTQGGRTVRTIADNLVVDPGGGVRLIDAKFSKLVDLSGKSSKTLRNTLTGNQKEAWEMIASHSAPSPVTITVGNNAKSAGLTRGQTIDPAAVQMQFHVSNKKGGIVPRNY